MKFSVNGKEMADWPGFIWRYEGRYLLRLKSIELLTSNVSFVPIYKPLFEWSSHGGQKMLDIFVRDLSLRITLQRRAPYVGVSLHNVKVDYD